MKRCALVVPDAGPFNSLWVADQLPLLLRLDMPIIVLDVVYDEMTSDPGNYPKDRDVKSFIDGNQPPFIIEETETGRQERMKRLNKEKPRRNAGDVAIADFMSEGIEKYAASDEPVLVLFEDSDVQMVRFLRKPPNIHLLSTVGLLRGLERVGVIASVGDIIKAMIRPKESTGRRVFNDLPEGVDDAAAIGSKWTP